jgi:hypothetical protein
MTNDNIVVKVVAKDGLKLFILPYEFGNKGFAISYCNEGFVDEEIFLELSDSFATIEEFQALLGGFGAEQFHHVFEYSPTDKKPVQDSYFQKLEDCEKALYAIFTVVDVNKNRKYPNIGRSFAEQKDIFNAIQKYKDKIMSLEELTAYFDERCEVFPLPALIDLLKRDDNDPDFINEETIKGMENCHRLTSGNWLLIS